MINQLEMKTEGAKTEILGTGINQIPYEGLLAVGKILEEGAKKYGVDNWKRGVGDTLFQEERLSHAIRHLMLYANGERLDKYNHPALESPIEDHLAKVAWFCLTQIWIRSQENKE